MEEREYTLLAICLRLVLITSLEKDLRKHLHK